MSVLSPLKGAFFGGIDLLPRRAQEKCLWHLAKKFGIQEMTVKWKYGKIQGSTYDEGIFHEIVKNREFSDDLIALILRANKSMPFKTFLDIGANIGALSIPLIQNTDVVSYAFEPEPGNFQMLEQNIFRYGFADRVRAYQVALFDKDAELEFELSDTHYGDHRLRVQAEGKSAGVFSETTRRTISVPAKRLDDLLRSELPAVPYVAKIDIQGAEYHAYAGGREILKRADLLLIELWPYAIERMGNNALSLVNMLLEDFPYGAILRSGKPYHDGDLNGQSSRFAASLRALAGDTHPDEWCDLVLSQKPLF